MNDLVSRSVLDAPGCLGWPAQERLSERDRPRACVYNFEPVIQKCERKSAKRNEKNNVHVENILLGAYIIH